MRHSNRFFFHALLFLAAFLLLTQLTAHDDIHKTEADNRSTRLDPRIEEAVENLTFYSAYNNQTLTEEELHDIKTGFYLPVRYGDVNITWDVSSPYVGNAGLRTIELRNENGTYEIEVVTINIISTPPVWKGNETFVLSGTFTYDDDIHVYAYTGAVAPEMGDGFLEGAAFTFIRYISLFLDGALTTLLLALSGTVLGFFLGMVLVFLRLADVNVSDSSFIVLMKHSGASLSKGYITVFRGTPMIVQASFFWYGLGLFGDALLCGLFVVSLNTGAYIAEILRGGVNAVDPGQKEAARSLGMSHTQTMIHVILPQGIKNALPAIGNEFIINIKDTAVLSIIGIYELFNQTRRIAGLHYRQLEAYFVVALIYLVLTYSMSRFLRYVEKKNGLNAKELTSSN